MLCCVIDIFIDRFIKGAMLCSVIYNVCLACLLSIQNRLRGTGSTYFIYI